MRVIYIISLLYISVMLATTAAAAGDQLSLEGFHKFSPGDDPAWASPAFDDSAWQQIRVPGSWQSQAVTATGGMGWYRIRFVPPVDLSRDRQAIALGLIGNADEVFLNGVRIGHAQCRGWLAQAGDHRCQRACGSRRDPIQHSGCGSAHDQPDIRLAFHHAATGY